MAWTLVSKATVANLHHLDTTSLQDEWSNWVEDMIKDHYGYTYIGTTTTISEEAHDGDGTPYVFVDNPPIVSVTTLAIGTITTNAITSTSYKVYDDHIQLINDPRTHLASAMGGAFNYFPIGQQNIKVTYVSGLASVPATVELCAAQMVAEIAKFYQKGGADSNSKFLPTQVMRDGRAYVLDRGLAATLSGIMKTLLRKRVIALG